VPNRQIALLATQIALLATLAAWPKHNLEKAPMSHGKFILLFAMLGWGTTGAIADTTEWIQLVKVGTRVNEERAKGNHGIVTRVECRISNGIPELRFTYERSKTPVFYNSAWSKVGKAGFVKFSKKWLTSSSKIFTCPSGKFIYGTQIDLDKTTRGG
jgi:hypothetical protein